MLGFSRVAISIFFLPYDFFEKMFQNRPKIEENGKETLLVPALQSMGAPSGTLRWYVAWNRNRTARTMVSIPSKC